MPISINGTGTITGISAGGLPDASVTADELASSAVTTAKVNDGAITYGKLSTSATESDNVAKRTAKAWVNFNGTGTVAIRDDFNVSSITDNGTGDYTVNFSTSLTNTNYLAIPYASRGGSVSNREAQEGSRGTSSYLLYTKFFNAGVASAAFEDMESIHLIILGE
jgi:hypothetical protein